MALAPRRSLNLSVSDSGCALRVASADGLGLTPFTNLVGIYGCVTSVTGSTDGRVKKARFSAAIEK